MIKQREFEFLHSLLATVVLCGLYQLIIFAMSHNYTTGRLHSSWLPYFDGEWRQGGLKQAGWHTDRTEYRLLQGDDHLNCRKLRIICHFGPSDLCSNISTACIVPNTANEDVKVAHIGMP